MVRAAARQIGFVKDPLKLGWRVAQRPRTLEPQITDEENAMVTLHIQHSITDFGTWTSAFQRFGDARSNAGVRAERIQRPVDGPKYVVIDLDFDTAGEARSFQAFLTTQVWANPKNSPGLAGTPAAMILELSTL
jgi:hypothetical protein